ncbi:uncharacterized protein LOC127249699 [Andrographis paniculata]|uniref:uncharacterized protein LOC127249699 n=1 Tax=Andrographis paniculata TaxID=175694 RepID=UPI0021E82854|nr:uncharacterized protein LOC127249699 [Andrographis paniculata]
MGCIPSKKSLVVRSRSSSLRENSNPGIDGVPWEELLASHSGSGKLFSLVAAKLRSSSFSMVSRDPETPQDADKFLSLIPEIPKNPGAETGSDEAIEPGFGRFTRSRSCQVVRDKDEQEMIAPGTDNKINWRDKNLVGSRSFHTVEEYDALVERIRRSSSTGMEQFRHYESWDNVEDPGLNSLPENKNKSMENEPGADLDCREGSNSPKSYTTGEDGPGETGWRRKSIAKGLKSLDIEFPVAARFRQRQHFAEGHIYSPGTYVTPKFGSYNAKVANEETGRQAEDCVFSPELVAVFEDCMQQLQEDEDAILNHIDTSL